MTPPENPATPPGVPVPYPNTAMATDTADGSRTVNISGKEVMLKNQSYFSKSTGNEAGSAAKKGVVTRSCQFLSSWLCFEPVHGGGQAKDAHEGLGGLLVSGCYGAPFL